MGSIREIIILFVQIALAFTAIQVYLQINKMWKRKHEREVADSQSISGLTIQIMSCLLSICYYVYAAPERDILSAIDTSFFLLQAIVLMLISTGLWVKGQEKLRFWQLVKKALKLERKEANYLIKKFFKPTNATIIISILHQIAMIDDYLDPKEEELIQAFAKEWNIEYSAASLNLERLGGKESNFMRLRRSVEEYLASEPEKEQAAQLRDMMNALINADGEVSPEEELMANELLGLIGSYISGSSAPKTFDVLIVPQKNEHHELIRQMMPDAKNVEISGGIAYSMGSFYSHKYAEMMCHQYRDVNLFTIVNNHNV